MTHTANLYKVMNEQFITYRGCCLRKLVGGYEWNNKKYANFTDLDKDIDAAMLAISESIKKGKQ